MKNRLTITPRTLRASAGLLLSVAAQLSAQVQTPLPTGGQVAAGSASITQSGNFMGITAGNGAIINWQSFNIGSGNTVQFYQPDASSRVLNRVAGADPSIIAGSLIANGNVYISNHAGVYFAHGSLVNVGGIYAAAGQITNANFLNNVNQFTNVTGNVVNQGTINAGSAHLIGRQAANFGTINAPGGVVTMTAGSDVLIGEQGGQVFARVSGGGQNDTGVTQAGQINARGGQAVFGAGDLYAMAIDHPGSTQAKRIKAEGGAGGVVSVSGTLDASDRNAGGTGGSIEVLGQRVGLFGAQLDASGDAGGGSIKIGGDWQGQGQTRRAEATYVSSDSRISADAVTNGNGGTVVVWADRFTNYQGRISARGGSQGGNGGSVETSGKKDLYMAGSVDASASRGLAGKWLLDPTDVTLSNAVTSGGSFGAGVFTPNNVSTANVNLTAIVNALVGGTSVTINTLSSGNGNGDITLVDPLSVPMAGGTATLTLNADRDIVINATITSTGAAGNELGLAFNAGRNIDLNSAITLNGGDFAMNAQGTVVVDAPITTGNGGLSIGNGTAPSATRLGQDIDAGTGNITISGPILLTGNIELVGHNLTFNGTIDSDSAGSNRNLLLSTSNSGTTRFNGNVGNTNLLGTLVTNADGTTVLNSQFVKGQSIAFNDAVVAAADAVVRGDTDVTFNSTIDSESGESNNLVVNSPISIFNGDIGNAGPTTFLGIFQTNVDGTSTFNNAAVKAERLIFLDNVLLGVDVTMIGTTSVNFASRIDSENGEGNDLTVNSPLTTFGGIIGRGIGGGLGALVTDGPGTTHLNSSAVDAFSMNFGDAVILGENATLAAATTITFASTLDSATAGAKNLTLDAPSVVLGGATGSATGGELGTFQLTSGSELTLDGPSLRAAFLDMIGDTIIGVDTTISGSTGVALRGTVNSANGEANELQINSPDTVILGQIGTNIGGVLGRLGTDAAGGTSIRTSIIEAEVMDFRDNVGLGVDVTLQGNTSVTFAGGIDSDNNAFNDLIVNSPLTVFLGDIGAARTNSRLGVLRTNISGTTQISSAQINASEVEFNDSVDLVKDVNISANSSITFNGSLDSRAGGGGNSLVLSSSLVTFAGRIGNLTSDTMLKSLTTTGTGQTLINTDIVKSQTVDFQNTLVIGVDTTITSPEGMTFQAIQSQLNEANDLAINSGGAEFNGLVGAGAGLGLGKLSSGQLSVVTFRSAVVAESAEFAGTANLNCGTLSTSNDQVYNGPVFLESDTTLEGRNITFNSTINSSQVDSALTVNSLGGGTTRFNGVVGSLTPLRSLTTNADGVTIFGSPEIFIGGTVNLNDRVSIAANTTISGTEVVFGQTVNSEDSSTPRSLTVEVTGSGTITFVGAVGDVNPLQRLTTGSEGVTKINGGAVTTIQSQAYNNNTVLGNPSTSGSSTILAGGSISFGGTLNSDFNPQNLTINTTNNGETTFNGDVGNLAPLRTITTNADGATRFFGTLVRTSLDQSYGDAVSLGEDIAFTANDITFNSTVDATPLLGAVALTINTISDGVTTFNAAVGSGAALKSITTNADGTTRIGANVTTESGGMKFDDKVLLFRDVTLTDAGSTGIGFGSTIDSEGSPQALSILTDITGNGTVASPSVPTIRFNGNIGSTLALRTLRIGANRSTVPTAATIGAGLNSSNSPISGYGLTINTTGAFTMGAFQKFSVLGNLTINSGGPAAIGDISTLGNLAITAPSIAVRTRPAAQTLGTFGNSLVLSTDTGVDFVAGGTINFSVTPTLLGAFGNPAFSTPNSIGISPNLSAFPQRAFGSAITTTLMFSGSTFLDLRSSGPSNTNIASVIAGAVPSATTSGDVVADTSIGREEREQLNQLGISTRTLDEKQFIQRLLGRGVVNDSSTDPTASDYTITANRLSPAVVKRVLDSYREVFFKETYDPATGQSEWTPQSERVGQVLSKSWTEYSTAAGAKADPLGFRAYLEALPAQAEALNYLDSLRDLIAELGYLGLTPAENKLARETILRSVGVQGMTLSQLEEAATARRMGGAS